MTEADLSWSCGELAFEVLSPSVTQYLFNTFTTSPYSVIVIATSQHTRDMRGPTPLYSAMTPSFCTMSRTQCNDDEYLDAPRPCIRLFTTSMPWKSSTETPPANAPQQAVPIGVLRYDGGITLKTPKRVPCAVATLRIVGDRPW